MYVHLVHVNGEMGGADYELVLGPFDGVQLTYKFLVETADGEHLAAFDARDGCWYPLNTENPAPYSDVSFPDELPMSVVG